MNPLGRYAAPSSLLRPFRRARQKTCAALVAALWQAAQASSFATAGQLACLTDVRLGSALTRLYRFLRNPRFDDWLLTEHLRRLTAAADGRLLPALDWTQWQDRHGGGLHGHARWPCDNRGFYRVKWPERCRSSSRPFIRKPSPYLLKRKSCLPVVS